jgi:hypothetical protein
MTAAIAAAARITSQSNAEYVRLALLRCLASDGVRLKRGLVEIEGGY